MHNKKLFKNTIMLTGFSILMRIIGLLFQIYISNNIGASGIGLFQLVLSVQALAITVATSGIRFAVTRLVSEVTGKNERKNIRPVVKCCFIYAFAFSVISSLLMFFGAGYIAENWTGDLRTEMPIRILSFSLIFISLTSVMGGYFTAVQRVGRAALIQLFEQLVMISTVLIILPGHNSNISSACSVLSLSSVISDILTFVLSLTVFCFDIRQYKSSGHYFHFFRRLISISVPLAASAYARTILTTLQHMLIPSGLKKSGVSANEALSVYGSIQGMVFPILIFPSALFTSLAELLIPELTEYQVSGNNTMMNIVTNRILKLCLSFSICCASILFVFGDKLGVALYGDASVGGYIRLLSPLVIIMYMDTVTDGMLKGLGQQLHSMGINIIDAGISLIFVYWLLPLYAIKAYIFIIFFSECFNFILSILRLASVSEIHIHLKDILSPFFCSLLSVNLSLLIINASGMGFGRRPVILAILLSFIFFIIICRLLFPASFNFRSLYEYK